MICPPGSSHEVSMVRLSEDKYSEALALYRRSELFFPLIAAVLLRTQDGVVYADDADSPTQFYVEHAFGFAQLFGEPNRDFEDGLARYLLIEGRFHAAKVRLYGLYVPEFLKEEHPNVSLSNRQRFRLGASHATFDTVIEELPHRDRLQLAGCNMENVAEIEEKFGVVSRFWRTPSDFIAHAMATIVLFQGKMAAICYSAATAEGGAEIDVMTLPDFRKLGLGKVAVAGFIDACRRQGVEPLWDCFTNNVPSMELARSVGYQPFAEPYSFYTINRPAVAE